MMLCNKTSRYHVAAAAIRAGASHNQRVAIDAHEKASYVMHLAQKTKEYIYANGKGQHVSVGETLDCTADDFF
jgi:xylulose-5-phosphate/fructose-6-phosphate phosphoketolase